MASERLRCESCGGDVEAPSVVVGPRSADVELFKLGVVVHSRLLCLEAYERKVAARVALREREEARR